jgi:hypothetical protein
VQRQSLRDKQTKLQLNLSKAPKSSKEAAGRGTSRLLYPVK